jgi:hypothetical protein
MAELPARLAYINAYADNVTHSKRSMHKLSPNKLTEVERQVGHLLKVGHFPARQHCPLGHANIFLSSKIRPLRIDRSTGCKSDCEAYNPATQQSRPA